MSKENEKLIEAVVADRGIPKDKDGKPIVTEDDVKSREFLKNVYEDYGDYGDEENTPSLWAQLEEEANSQGRTVTRLKEVIYAPPAVIDGLSIQDEGIIKLIFVTQPIKDHGKEKMQ